MTVLVVGLGFVGLTAALGFAEKGVRVFGREIDWERAETIRSGKLPFAEPGLEDALKRHLGELFTVPERPEDLPEAPECVFLCVDVPCDETGTADLRRLISAAESAAPVCGGSLLVVKSTVPPGTTDETLVPRLRAAGITNSVAVNPEFLRDGKFWQDFIEPDRIVCGVADGDRRAVELLSRLYEPFGAPIHFTARRTAEFVKYLSNCLLTNQISFSNEMALIADAVGGVDVKEAFRILHEDRLLRGAGICHYLYPGCGYGGYRLPKDAAAMLQSARSRGCEPSLLSAAIRLNDAMPRLTAEKILRHAGSAAEPIGILGLSFRPDSDNVWDSPAAKIIALLLRVGRTDIRAYDPAASRRFAQSYHLPIRYCASAEELCESCRTVALVTAWSEFAGLNKRYPAVNWVDCRYFFDGTEGTP